MGRVLVFFLIVMVVLAGTGIFDQIGQREGGEVPQDVLRLHIRAHSDAPRDQETKLAVRDAVLAVLAPGLRRAASAAEACQLVKGQIGEITAAARKELQRRGNQEPVTVRLDRTYFPTRQYDGITFPAGEYLALQIFLGEGAGTNWWCVLFPPLCLVDGTTARAVKAEGELAGDGEVSVSSPEIRFKIVEWFRALTGK